MNLTTDDIDDIKQIITANNAVLLAELDEHIDEKLDEKLAPITQKIDDLTDFVRDAIDASNEATGEQLSNHEQRITSLEKRAA